MVMKSEDQTIRELVVCAAANDYENFEMVVKEVTRWAAEEGTDSNRQTIFERLSELITDGFMRAYVYSRESARYEMAECSRENLDELWFYVTDKGKQFVTELGGIDGK
jgi:hypothetical protein